MATKKAAEEKPAEKQDESTRNDALNDMGTSDTSGKTIDERMAQLLKDHKRMGAR